jgi:methyl-accepting chemotaxis protein I, serine sensor receptor
MRHLSITARLWITVTILGALIVATATLGAYGTKRSDDDLSYAYSNQLAAAIAIGKANVNLTIVRTTLDRVMLHPDSPDTASLIDKALNYLSVSDKAWKDYSSRPHSADEQALANAVSSARADIVDKGIMPMIDALKKSDRQTADDIAMRSVPPLSVALTKASDALAAWQNQHGKEAFAAAKARSGAAQTIGSVLLVVGLLACVACAVTLNRSIARPLTKILEQMQRMAAGDLSERLEEHSQDEMGQLVVGLMAMQASLTETVRQVTRSAESIAAATRQIAAGNSDLSQRTEEQAASLEQTAASMEELTATVKHNSDNARTAQTVTGTANDVVLRGAAVVENVVETMGGIDQASKKIADITGVIEGIAFQTNILALNAAVEAARAGEQGRGFAVVAGEVRSLAQRAGGAAKEIKELIGDSVARVGAGTKLVDSAGHTMQEIRESISKVTAIMDEIASASDQQRNGIEQVGLAVSQMDEVSQQNAALVEQAAAAAASLENQAELLRRAVGAFKLEKTAGFAPS